MDPARKQVASYQSGRPELLALLKNPKKVLDVGCNTGTVGADILRAFPSAQVVGLDIQPAAVDVASHVIDQAICIDLDNHEAVWSIVHGSTYDTIIVGDVLEHLKNPWGLLEILVDVMEPGGRIIASVPNVGHWELVLQWMRQSWPLNDRGIFDNTHLRFFMFKDVGSLAPAGTRVFIRGRNFRLRDQASRWDRVLKYMVGWLPYIREFFVFQYIFVVIREPNALSREG
jgi:2-polyprenyl-3-methyl-5-hydroxy-6-metoxy-1,4-benzoquinol methylase